MSYVTWPQLLEWAKAHGAINENITSISIGTDFSNKSIMAVVTIKGHAKDTDGHVYAVNDGEGRNRLASWEVTNHVLRSLP